MKNSKILNGRHFWGDKIFGKLGLLLGRNTLSLKNFVEIALSRKVFKIQAFLCFAIFAKKLKIQNGRHFWRDKIFLKIGLTTLLAYSVG